MADDRIKKDQLIEDSFDDIDDFDEYEEGEEEDISSRSSLDSKITSIKGSGTNRKVLFAILLAIMGYVFYSAFLRPRPNSGNQSVENQQRVNERDFAVAPDSFRPGEMQVRNIEDPFADVRNNDDTSFDNFIDNPEGAFTNNQNDGFADSTPNDVALDLGSAEYDSIFSNIVDSLTNRTTPQEVAPPVAGQEPSLLPNIDVGGDSGIQVPARPTSVTMPPSGGLADISATGGLGLTAPGEGGAVLGSGRFSQRELDLLRAPMMVLNGGAGLTDVETRDGLKETDAEKVTATRIMNPGITIARGKMIEAVLETAVDTTLEGFLRAVINRDVYAEAGDNILIKRGARAIGTYRNSVETGATRVYMVWERIINPDGTDIKVDSSATDQLGRAGASGIVNNRYVELFGNSMLVSLVTISTALIVDALTGGNTEITEDIENDGSTVLRTNAVGVAAEDAINNISDLAQQILEEKANQRPVITIPQGTSIRIFVNRDLIFPVSSYYGVEYIK